MQTLALPATSRTRKKIIQCELRCQNNCLLHKLNYEPNKRQMPETLENHELQGSQNHTGPPHNRSSRKNYNVNHGKPGHYQHLSKPWRNTIWAKMWHQASSPQTYCPSFADSDSSKTKNGHLKYRMLETLKDHKLPGSHNQAGAAHNRSIRTISDVNHGKPGLYQQRSEPWRRIVIWATMW